MPKIPPIHPRSTAFDVQGPGLRPQFLYWTIEAAWNEPDHFYIREYQVECSRPGSMSRPVTDNLTEAAAFGKLAELERTAAAKYPLVDVTTDDARQRLGDTYFQTSRHFPDCHMPRLREDALTTLRQRRKTASLGLKLK